MRTAFTHGDFLSRVFSMQWAKFGGKLSSGTVSG